MSNSFNYKLRSELLNYRAGLNNNFDSNEECLIRTEKAIRELILSDVVGKSEPFTGNNGKYPEVRNGLREEQRKVIGG